MNAQKTGSLIATIRKEQNRTQQDLANELGVYRPKGLQMVCNYNHPHFAG